MLKIYKGEILLTKMTEESTPKPLISWTSPEKKVFNIHNYGEAIQVISSMTSKERTGFLISVYKTDSGDSIGTRIFLENIKVITHLLPYLNQSLINGPLLEIPKESSSSNEGKE